MRRPIEARDPSVRIVVARVRKIVPDDLNPRSHRLHKSRLTQAWSGMVALRGTACARPEARFENMDPFFFVTLPDGTKQRLMRFDAISALPAALTSLMGISSSQLDLIRLPVGRTVTLMQSGTVPDGAKTRLPDITSSDDQVIKVGRVVRRGASEQTVEARATGDGFAWLSCMAAGAGAGTPLGV